MKEIFNTNRRPIIILGIVMGLIYAGYMIFIRLGFAFGSDLKQYGELAIIPFDLLIGIPAFLGLFYFYKNNKTSNWLVPFAYFVYAISLLAGIATIFIGDSALGTGLVFIMIIVPIVIVVSILLFFILVQERSK